MPKKVGSKTAESLTVRPIEPATVSAGQTTETQNGDSNSGATVEAELRELRAEVARLKSIQDRSAIVVTPNPEVASKELSSEIRDERQSFAESLPIPGRDAPTFNLVNDFLSFGVTPWADSLVPAYLLDKNYRIVDWNLAFSLAFDRTMEGRRGLAVLEWVYFLDNYEESLKTAARDFADPENLPRLHVETIEYTSLRYGKLFATKRAYQMPKDGGEILGWLVTLDIRYADLKTTLRFRRDLFATLRHDLTWSEYALSYDRVLLASNTYRKLLANIVGDQIPSEGIGNLTPLRTASRILDLGSGTGNLAQMLAKQGRRHVIFALENNRIMLDLLRDKCDAFLRSDDEGPGILPIKQDVNALFGIPDHTFDYAILNNVAYALDDPLPCFRQVRQALKPNGEIRISGPQKKTNLEVLFARIGDDLKASGQMTELAEDFQRVLNINQTVLGPTLYRWTVEEMQDLLRSAGFGKIVYSTDSAYAGQSMIVVATR